jgi:hypothetical protein
VKVWAALVVVLLVGRASAQPLKAVGQPLPDPSMAAGTVTVRVVAGEITKPAEGVPVTLAADGKPKVQKTDASGRATFENVLPKSRVTVSFPSAAPELARSTFVMPDTGGVRLFMSSAKWKVATLPSLRETSGIARRDRDIAAGTIAVRLTYDNLDDPKPPSGVAVTLVGYAADGKVSVKTAPTDAKGVSSFTGLDTSERTAYYASAVLPRIGTVDRLLAEPITLDAAGGARVVLSSYKRDSKEPPIDLGSVPKGKVSVKVVNPIAEVGLSIELFDAATGKPIATAPSRDPETVFDAKTGVVYAQLSRKGIDYRSRPVPLVAGGGAHLELHVMPRITPTFDAIAVVEDDRLDLQMRWQLRNNSWLPFTGGIEVPLPAGFKDLELRDEDTFVKKSPKGVRIDAPLPPGGKELIVAFSLPIVNQRAKVALDLPSGSLSSSLKLKKDPGVALADLPAGVTASDAAGYAVISGITLTPGKSLAFTVTAPKPDPKAMAIKKTCRELAPNRESPLIGKPMLDFTAPQLDGKPFKLSSLKGKLIFVTFNGSFSSLRNDQKTLPALATKLGAELVQVWSDANAADVRKQTTDGHVVLDPPVGDSVLGPITGRYDIVAIPETYVIDRKGVIKFHLINQRDWSLPSALACLKTGI